MDLEKTPENFVLSSASTYEVSLAVFHNSHGLSTPTSADRVTIGPEGTKLHRRRVADRINIWN